MPFAIYGDFADTRTFKLALTHSVLLHCVPMCQAHVRLQVLLPLRLGLELIQRSCTILCGPETQSSCANSAFHASPDVARLKVAQLLLQPYPPVMLSLQWTVML